MDAFRHTARVVATTVAALALATGLSTNAQAANGTLHYVNVNGDDFTTENPANGECFLLVSGAIRVDNRTDSEATVYSDHGCEDPLGSPMPPFSSRDFGEPVPHSVMFG
ncbi:hypothetical protein ACGFMM_31565 [Streptomyces sp. NPDC048604]|uniref:hypothetical protein n=1 Tax=Streptomyces sp. NPDC048604 TaxID=3365578 RepID=UPI00371D1482